MDSLLKIVYSRWIGNDPLPNGLTDEFAVWASRNIEDIDTRFFFNDPTSTYYFRQSNFFEHCKRLKIPLVHDTEITDNGIYLYPLEIECNSIQYIISKQDNYDFIETLSPTMLDHLRAGRVRLLLVNMIDPSIESSVIEDLDLFLKNNGIPGAVLLQGNTRFDVNTSIPMLDSVISLYQTANEMDRYPYQTSLGYISDYVRASDLTDKVRPKKFLSFNRFMNRSHRTGLAYIALKYNLLPDGYFSFLYNPKDDYEDSLRRLNLPTEPFADAIRSMVPRQLDTDHLDQTELSTFFTVTNYRKDLYQNSYVHIVTETQFEKSVSPFMSEKTWRPILNLQPFIYLGNPFSLNTLRMMGFKTFEPFIDESYDKESDPVKRFALVENEIKKLNSLSLDEIHKWYVSISDILIHNQTLLYSYKTYNPLCNLLNLN